MSAAWPVIRPAEPHVRLLSESLRLDAADLKRTLRRE